jgi:hypothetical protein
MDVSFYQSAKNLEQPFSDFHSCFVKSAFIAIQPIATNNLVGTENVTQRILTPATTLAAVSHLCVYHAKALKC